jgi:iron complex transport system substrate-binding protein
MRKILLVAITILIFTLSGAQTIQNRYAKGFTIEKTHNGYIVKILNPYSKDNPVFEQYTLIKDEKYRKNRLDIKIPIKRMALLSSPFVGMAEALECIDNISAIDNPTYIYNRSVYNKSKSGTIKTVGESHDIRVETLLTSGSEVVFMPGWRDSKSQNRKITGASLPVIYMFSYLEQHPLGRAEWIKLMALFTGKIEQANRYFESTVTQYNTLAKLVSTIEKPREVMSGGIYRGLWYAPGNKSYMAVLLNDAGGRYIFDNVEGTGSVSLKREAVLLASSKADVWLTNAMGEIFPSGLQREKIFNSRTRPWRMNKIYSNIKAVSDNGANAYWENGPVNPHHILADYIKILYPELLPDHKFVYYKHIDVNKLK